MTSFRNRLKNNQLRLKLAVLNAIFILLTVNSASIYSTYLQMDEQAQLTWEYMKRFVADVQYLIRDQGFDSINDSYEAGILGERLEIFQENGRQKSFMEHPYADGGIVNTITEKIVNSLIKDRAESIREKQNQERKNNSNFYTYTDDDGYIIAVYERVFISRYGVKTKVKFSKNITQELARPIYVYFKSLPLLILISLLLGFIGSMLGLHTIFKNLLRLFDEGFDEVIKSNFSARMYDRNYGKEMNVAVDKVNYLLEEMHKNVNRNVEIIQDTSHEINNDLAAIKTSAEILLRVKNLEDNFAKRKIQAINERIDKITSTIKAILEMARLKQGTMNMRPEKHPARELVDRYLLDVRKDNPSIAIEVLYDPREPIILISQQHFDRAINPIISNAIKYAIDNNKIVIKIDTYQHSGETVIGVTNWGPTIPKEQIPKLFKRYYTISNQARTKIPGTGLGLSLSMHVMEIYKGKIDVDSKNRKTTFYLKFPSV